MKCDVLNKEAVNSIIALFRPDITIYCVGLSSLMGCHLEPKIADALNSSGVVNVASSSERYGAQFIYLSSAMVMAGDDVLYKEGDTPFPISVYGVSVSQSEFYIQKSCLNYLILRCGKLYGRTYRPYLPNWFEVIEKKTEDGTVIGADDQLRIGFMDVQLCAHYVDKLLQTEVTNKLVHLSTLDVCTYYEFSEKMLKALKYESFSLTKKDWHFPMDENQLKLAKPLEKFKFHLDNSNIEILLGEAMPTIDKSIEFSANRFLAS
jgi:dTDP-4-dehydrorhamnose reductase